MNKSGLSLKNCSGVSKEPGPPLGTATGKTLLRKLIFENTREGFEKLSAYVDAVKTRHTLPKAIFGLEPTGDYHKPLAEYLVRRAIRSSWKQVPR